MTGDGARGANRQREAMRVFEAVVDLDEGPRAAAIDAACADDDALRAAVLALIAADATPPSWTSHDALVRAVAIDLLQDDRGLMPGDTFAGFTVLERLGVGGTSTVYRAHQPRPDRQVALKILHAWLVDDPARGRFRFEADVLARIGGDGIPRVWSTGEEDGRPWIAMEFALGVPITAWVAQESASAADRLALLIAVARAVGRAHGAGLVHRDIKPENVVVTPEGTALVLDFGVSARVDAPEAEARQPVGTPTWRSPEVEAGGAATLQSDVWSLGALARLLLPRQLPADLQAVLHKATAANPAQRYPDAAALADDLERARDHLPVAAIPPTLPYLTQTWLIRHRRALRRAAAVLALTGAAAGAVLADRAWEARARAARGEERLTAVREATAALAAAGHIDAARSEVRRLIDAPELAGTPAVASGWVLLAGLEPLGSDAALDALASAWQTSVDPGPRCAAIGPMIDALQANLAFDSLGAAVGAFEREGCGAAGGDRGLGAALARWDVDAALAALGDDDPRRPMLRALGGVRALGGRGGVVEILGDPTGRLLRVDDAQHRITEVRRSTSLEPVRSWDASGVDLRWPRTHVVDLGEPWLLAPRADALDELVAWRFGDAALIPVSSWFEPRVQKVALDQGQIVLATGPYERHLVQAAPGPAGWTHAEIAPRLGLLQSDLMSVLPVGGDLYVGVGPWWGYGVVRLDPSRAVTAYRPLGYVNDLAAVQTPAGLRVAALKSDRYANTEVFADPDGFGEAPGIWLLDPSLAGGEPVSLRLSASLQRRVGYVHAWPGDLDGDGLTDLVAWVELDGASHLWTLRQTPDGRFAGALWPDIAPVLVTDLDQDGDAELIGWEHFPRGELVLLGAGPGDQRRATPPPTEAPPAPALLAPSAEAWRRAEVLASLGLVSRAGDLLEASAGQAPRGDAAELYRRAGALAEQASDAPTAWRRYSEARRLGAEVAADLHRTALARLDLAAALDVATAMRDEAEIQRLEALIRGPRWTWRAGDPVRDGWRIHTPEAVRLRDGALQVEVFNGVPTALSHRLQPADASTRVGLAVTVDPAEMDGGVEPAISLTTQGAPSVRVELERGPRGGVRARCELPALHGTGWFPDVELPTSDPLTIEVERLGDVVACRFRQGAWSKDLSADVAEAWPLPDAVWIGDGSAGDYGILSTRSARLTLHTITVLGASAVAEDTSGLAWDIAQGRAPARCDVPELCLAAAVDRADEAALARLVARLPIDALPLRRLVRARAPFAGDLLQRILPPPAWATLAVAVWHSLDHENPAAERLSALDHPWLDALDAGDPVIASLMQVRAETLQETGEITRAAAIFERVGASERNTLRVRIGALERLAACRLALGQPDAARDALREVLALSPVPDAARARWASGPLRDAAP